MDKNGPPLPGNNASPSEPLPPGPPPPADSTFEVTAPTMAQKHHNFQTRLMASPVAPTLGQTDNVLDNFVPAALTSIRSSDEILPQPLESDSTLETKKAPIYINRELEKNIFPYGPLVTSKIDGSQVPRPKNLPKEFKPIDKSAWGETVPSDCFMTPTYQDVPMFSETFNRLALPMALVVQPFADEPVPLVDFIQHLGEVDLSRQDLIRCPKCAAYWNPYMEFEGRNDIRTCNLCYEIYPLQRNQLITLETLKMQVSAGKTLPPEKTRIMSPSVDFVAPLKYYSDVAAKSVPMREQLSNLLQKASDFATNSISLKSSSSVPTQSVVYDTYGVVPSSAPVTPRSTDSRSSIAGPANAPSAPSTPTSSIDPFGGKGGLSGRSLTNDSPPPAPSALIDSNYTHPDAEIVSYIFVVETTMLANRLELKASVLNALAEATSKCDGCSVKFCIMTFDSSVHLYQQHHGEFTLVILTEIDEVYIPLHYNDLFIDASNYEECDAYFHFIGKACVEQRGSENCGNYALSMAIRLLHFSQLGGTVTMFFASPPDYGVGKCTELTISDSLDMDPKHKLFYDDLIHMCYDVGIAVDVYICTEKERIPCDLLLQYISQQTAGHCYYLAPFDAKCDTILISKNIHRLFTVLHAYKCEVKLRCSANVHIKEVIVPFSNPRAILNASTLMVPRLSPDTALLFQMDMDDAVETTGRNTKPRIYFQCACMYNSGSCTQPKLIRVQTLPLDVTSSVQQIFKNINASAVLNYYTRFLSYKFLKSGNFDKKRVVDQVVACLCSYRLLCAPTTPSNQLILPDNLKLLPGCLNALFKLNCTSKFGAFFIQRILRSLLAPTGETDKIYSRSYCLHRSLFEPPEEDPPAWNFTLDIVPSSTGAIYSDGMYLIDDGIRLTLYFGPHVKWSLLQQLFGPELVINEKTTRLALVDSPTTQNLYSTIDVVRAHCPRERYKHLYVVPYASRHHRILKSLLLEDEIDNEPSYINFLVTLHKHIRQAQANKL